MSLPQPCQCKMPLTEYLLATERMAWVSGSEKAEVLRVKGGRIEG